MRDLSQNLSAELLFIRIISVVMIVGVVTDFEMTFTVDLLKVTWQNNDFVFSLPKKKIGYCPPKNSDMRSRAILSLLFNSTLLLLLMYSNLFHFKNSTFIIL